MQHYVESVNKKTGNNLVEKCFQPGSIERQGDANILFGMVGTRSYNNFPIWGNMEGDNLTQIITSYELELYKNTPEVSIPKELNIEEESNPIVVVYKIKK